MGGKFQQLPIANRRVSCRCHDWWEIERDYCTGSKTVAQIAREQGISASAIHHRARLRGWQRDLSVQAQRRAEARQTRKVALEARHEIGRAASSLTWPGGGRDAGTRRLPPPTAPATFPIAGAVEPSPGRKRKHSRGSHDWDEIERDYRAGVKSISQIAREQEISRGSINQRARLRGWERDLRDQVQRRAWEKLAQEAGPEGQSAGAAAAAIAARPNDRAFVELDGEAIAHVVRGHREDLVRLRHTLACLHAPLEAYLDALEASVEGEPAPAFPPALAAILGPRQSLADLVLKLTGALARLIAQERRAFGLHEACAALPPDPETLAARDRAILADIRASVAREVAQRNVSSHERPSH